VGISVSRVGGSAQIKSMKKVAGTLKLDQAFTEKWKPSLNLVVIWMRLQSLFLDKGARNVEILKQGQFHHIV
jgi:F-type H+-transporting ATPase subunit alpha